MLTSSFFIICFCVGAVQSLAPDRWGPASLLCWQRGWGLGLTLLYSTGLWLLHLLAGSLLFIPLLLIAKFAGIHTAWVVGVVGFLAMLVFRMSRLPRVRDVFLRSPYSLKSSYIVLSLLGPAEALALLMLKVFLIQGHLLSAVAAYASGTLAVAGVLVVVARLGWNQPQWLPLGLAWMSRRGAWWPAVVSWGVVIGFGVIRRF